MKLWIIYNDGLVISRVIADMLQDRLENYIDVSVGKTSKIDPSLIVEEELDYLIIGDMISETVPSVEIQKWVYKYGEISKGANLRLKGLSGFVISINEMNNEKHWVEFIHDLIMTETMNPPILFLKRNKTDLAFKSGVHEIVKEYSRKFIEFITNEPKKTNKKYQRRRNNFGK